ncbi:MAG: phosphoethanolamine--lipid A transferase [Candidatus Thiodiazotropha sp.]
MTYSKLILGVALFLLVVGNFSFFSHLLGAYPLNLGNLPYLLSLAVLFGCVNVILLSLLSYGRATKPVLIVILLASAAAAYFMDAYQVIIDDDMIDNVLKTDMAESLDLISLKLVLYLLLIGIVPAFLVYRVPVVQQSLRQAIFSRAKLAGGALVLAVATVLLFGSFYASFAREHKALRYYANPSYYLYAIGKTIGKAFKQEQQGLRTVGEDAKIPESDEDRELVILVVGETARADHFSLNGYARETNPLLANEKIASFTNTWACGTSTAVSVPCMFSIYDQEDYSKEKASHTENLLDVLQRAGVNVVWLDNNSDSKGVADRVPYQSFKSPDVNPDCDSECRDVGMLENLQTYIDEHPSGDIFIVLHQMGNHGPAYYKRYPAAYERFTPVCQTNELADCERQAIDNTYDNAILYTDYFLSRVIELLKQNSESFEAAMFYISDHGESLGENNLYLHGLPDLLAPDVQKRVPMIFWFSDSFLEDGISIDQLLPQLDESYSHDNVFHTVLGLFEVETGVYDPLKDLVKEKTKE